MINVQVQIANLIIGNWILIIGYLKKGGLQTLLVALPRSMFNVQ